VDASGRGLGDGVRASGEQRYQAEFTGTAGEYFRIWIVNLALTILTLGIYSAWAKVRKRRYFYAHTRIAGESFEYRGRPIAILLGRLFALALLVIVIAAGNLVPELSLESFSGKALFFAAAVLIGPWLLVRSSKFNASNSVYRNIRLSFLGTYGSCFRVVIRYVWLVFFGILYPYFKHRLVKYSAENHAFGDSAFQAADFKKPFIHAYAVAFGSALLGAVILLAVFSASAAEGVEGRPELLPILIYAGFLALYAFRARPHDECRVERNPHRAAALRVQPARA
jgi:uncharacterized membrane protein YjgN (DUF898 family)